MKLSSKSIEKFNEITSPFKSIEYTPVLDVDESEDTQKSPVRSRSLSYRLFLYFTTFIVVIMLILWLLQILFLQPFYQAMKSRELYKIAESIETKYGKANLYDAIANLTVQSDMYIQIDTNGDILYATTSSTPGDRMNDFATSYDTTSLKARLDNSETPYVVSKQAMSESGGEVMIYASILGVNANGDKTYLVIFTPLTAVGSTIQILANMLIIVTIVAVALGLILSVVISRRITRPLSNIATSAAILGEGGYSTHFDGTGYAETEKLADALNYAAEELAKSDKLQKDLIANVSHDLKTPLTMVKSYAEMIRDLSGDDPEKRNKHLHVIISEADRLNGLVNDLTMLSKMQANVDVLTPQEIDLEKVANETIDTFALHSEKNGFQFSVVKEGAATVVADEKKIRQVFANLIGNAIRYSSDDKRIQVRLTERENSVLCEIIDHGQGIAEEDQAAVWDRYYQSSQNHSRTSQGSGLGLSIVKQIFVLHGAKYGIVSRENEGSNFWFELKKTLKDKT